MLGKFLTQVTKWLSAANRKRIIVAAFIILDVCLYLLVRCISQSPPADPKSDRLAFLAKPVSEWFPKNIIFYVINVDTIGSTSTSSNLSHGSPEWSPRGDKIAYFNDDGLLVANVDNIEQSELIWEGDGWGQVWWSPDGSKIASLSPKGIYIFDLKNRQNVKRIDTFGNAGEWPPQLIAWSPSGSKIAVSGNDGLRVFDVETDRVSKMTLPEQGFNTFDEPDWSPHGSKIVFRITSRVYEEYAADHPGGIAMMNADGSQLIRLTSVDGDSFPKWSPDARQVAFIRLRTTYASSANIDLHSGDIYIMNADGTDLKELTQEEEIAEPFVWSPDGARIAFIGRDITACRSWGLDTVTYYCPEAIKVIGVNDSKAVLIRDPRNEWIGNLIWLSPD